MFVCLDPALPHYLREAASFDFGLVGDLNRLGIRGIILSLILLELRREARVEVDSTCEWVSFCVFFLFLATANLHDNIFFFAAG